VPGPGMSVTIFGYTLLLIDIPIEVLRDLGS